MVDSISFTSASLSGGAVVVSGTITCTSGDCGEVQVAVSQGKGRSGVEGSAYVQDASLATGRAVSWTLTVTPKQGAFSAGAAHIELRGNSFKLPQFTFDGGKHTTTDVTL